jgi:carboxylate-amine ligase
VASTWRIAENRWWAARHGLDASLADLVTGAREPLRARLERLFDELAPVAARLDCAVELERARALAAGPGGAARQRAEARARGGLDGLVGWLAERALA